MGAWQSFKFLETAPDIAKRIRETESVETVQTIVATDGIDRVRADWDAVKYDILLKILRAKFEQHAMLRDKLLESGDRLIANVGTDRWEGMSAAGGIATGDNNMGKALMQVREELRTSGK